LSEARAGAGVAFVGGAASFALRRIKNAAPTIATTLTIAMPHRARRTRIGSGLLHIPTASALPRERP
jgi:hypothetical protein